MAEIVIKTIRDAEQFQQKIRTLKAILPKLKKESIRQVSENELLESIQTDMSQNNFSEKIIDATFIGPIDIQKNQITIHVISDYVSDSGFDVSKGREEGTSDHIVRPKNPASILRWKGDGGKTLFSKLNRVSGIQRLLIIEKNIKKLSNTITESYKKNISNMSEKILVR